jgi:hypothetical protein
LDGPVAIDSGLFYSGNASVCWIYRGLMMKPEYLWDFTFDTYRRRDNKNIVEEFGIPIEWIQKYITEFNLKLNSSEQFDPKMITTAESAWFYFDDNQLLGMGVAWEGGISIFSKAEWVDIDWEDDENFYNE